MTIREEYEIISKFKVFFIERLKGVRDSIPAFIPQTEEDKRLFRKGLQVLDDMIYDLENATNVRDIAQYIDVEKVVDCFEEEGSLDKLQLDIANSTYSSIDGLGRSVQGEWWDEENDRI